MARVIVRHGEEGETTVPLHGGSVTVGRDHGSDLTLDADAVSPLHASLYEDNARWYVKDEGSRYGTFVNDRRVTEQGLTHGDVVEFGLGGPTLRFESEEQAPGDDEEPITLEEVVPVPEPDYGQEGYTSFTTVRPALLDPPVGRDEETTVEREAPPRPDEGTTVEREAPASPGDETTVEREVVPRSDDGATVELPSPGAGGAGVRRAMYAVGGLVLVAAAVIWLRACATPLAGGVRDTSSPPDAPGATVARPGPGATTPAPLPPPS